MATIMVICANCGQQVEKYSGEINRSNRLGRRFFCDSVCSAKMGNIPRTALRLDIYCPCGKKVTTSTRARAKKHCSRECASLFSITEYAMESRRESGRKSKNLLSPAEVLKRREAPKYVLLKQHLSDRLYEFEYEIDGYVFDLALFDVKILIEFDGHYHGGSSQGKIDVEKNEVARKHGFRIIRRKVQSGAVITVDVLNGLPA